MKEPTTEEVVRWLGIIKSKNMKLWEKFSTCLNIYDRDQVEKPCYQQVSQMLQEHPAITWEINDFLEQGVQFPVDHLYSQKIYQLGAEILKFFPEEKVYYIDDPLKLREENYREFIEECPKLLAYLLSIVQGNQKLQRMAYEIFQGKEVNQQLRLPPINVPKRRKEESSYLPKRTSTRERKSKKNTPSELYVYEDLLVEIDDRLPTKKVKRHQELKEQVEEENPEKRKIEKKGIRHKISPFQYYQKNQTFNNKQERELFLWLKEVLTPFAYQSFFKLLHLYRLTIISLQDLMEQMKKFQLTEKQFQILQIIFKSRLSGRFQQTQFKPMEQKEFLDRVGPSYVVQPHVYEQKCSTKTKDLQKILNNKFRVVPFLINFDEPIQGQHISFLIKKEDEEEQIDRQRQFFRGSLTLLKRTIKIKDQKTKKVALKQVVTCGIIQILYQDATLEQKRLLEKAITFKPDSVLQIIQKRLENVLLVYNSLKKTENNREQLEWNWNQSINIRKEYWESKDRKFIKGQYFIQNLRARYNYLKNKGKKPLQNDVFYAENFFEVCNSFYKHSKIQKCARRDLVNSNVYDIENTVHPEKLPTITMAYQDEKVNALLYSILINYLQLVKKKESYEFFYKICKRFLKWDVTRKKIKQSLTTAQLNKLFFSEKVKNISRYTIDIEEVIDNCPQKKPKGYVYMNYLNDGQSNSFGFPKKNENTMVFFGSEKMYVFFRFLHTAFEWLLRAKQTLSLPKFELFEMLLLRGSCCEKKISSWFQLQMTSYLFGSYEYMFKSLPFILSGLVQSLDSAKDCILNKFSIDLFHCFESEEFYHQRFYQENMDILVNVEVVRLIFNTKSKYLYINSLKIILEEALIEIIKGEKDPQKRKEKIAKRKKQIDRYVCEPSKKYKQSECVGEEKY